MRRLLLPLLFVAVGCVGDAAPYAAHADELFVAREVRLHPVFTKVSDWNGDGKPDGFEALVELHDQFGDTCKGAGTFTFEVFEFRRDQPDPRGPRLSQPWISQVLTPDEQRERWSKTGRCYTFRLQSDVIKAGGGYVLAVTFTPASGPRAFDRVVLLAPRPAPATAPTQAPPTTTAVTR